VPTEEQLASRKQLADFIAKVGKPIRNLAKNIKSEWFGRPDEELKGWIERGQAIEEIKGSLGYRLIITQADKEIRWAQAELEVCDEKKVIELRMYLRSLRFLHDFILTTERNADIASTVLAGREKEIGRDSQVFVRNARVEGN
jgi:hypothetical protein